MAQVTEPFSYIQIVVVFGAFVLAWVGEPGIETYSFSTRCGYFSSLHSKRYLATASIPLRIYKKAQSQGLNFFVYVGEPGIEPGPHGPKPRTLPLCYTPMQREKSKNLNSSLQ
jgi:hypothetical protein